MNSKQYTDYKILRTIEGKSDISQRLISQQTGINVASVNFALKRLIQKGYITVTSMNKKRIMYHLTHSGISQKAKLAYNFFLINYHLFSDIREIVSLRFEDHSNLKGKNIAIFGLNEITEIIYFCMKKKGVHFAGVYEDNQKLIGTNWLGEPVRSLDQLRKDGQIDYLIDVKTAVSNNLDLVILTPEDFIKKKAQLHQEKKSFANNSSKLQLKIYGAKDTVTGSCILLKAGGKNILIDCGNFQGNGKDPKLKNDHFVFNPVEINYLFLTHAHIDHSGQIPLLIDQGFKGEILCHHATIDLLPILLADSFKLNGYNPPSQMELPGITPNKEELSGTIPHSEGELSALIPPIKGGLRGVLSPDQLIEKVIELSWGFEYNQWNQISKNIRFRFLDAGHILGSATIQFDIDGEYIVFSGDIGNQKTGIIRDPVVPDRADTLVLESTYGGVSHQKTDKKEKFKEIIKRVLKNNGKALIPAFAIGRTQEIIYQLNDLVEKGEIQNVPVFVDSPMGIKITEIYKKHMKCFDEETFQRLENKDDPHPLEFNKLFAVEHYRDSIRIGDLAGPAIIIAGCSMCTGGSIINYILNLIGDKAADIIFVGYQAEGTIGAEILNFSKRKNGHVLINEEKVSIKARVHEISGFSAHADHEGLLKWVEKIEHKPSIIYLNHGEGEAQAQLKKGLQDKFKNITVLSNQ